MIIDILTIFPEMIRAVFDYGVIGKAIQKGVLAINPIDLRDFSQDKHRSVDGKPYGGGPGMVLRVDVIDTAISKLRTQNSELEPKTTKIILLSPKGELFSQEKAREYSQLSSLILISGRYEGVDERVREHLIDDEISIGKYVLSGGEIPAMVVADAVARLIPGVLGDPSSLIYESFSPLPLPSSGHRISSLDFPQYTEPAGYKGWVVPAVLRSGNHQLIKDWRAMQSTRRSPFDASSSRGPYRKGP